MSPATSLAEGIAVLFQAKYGAWIYDALQKPKIWFISAVQSQSTPLTTSEYLILLCSWQSNPSFWPNWRVEVDGEDMFHTPQPCWVILLAQSSLFCPQKRQPPCWQQPANSPEIGLYGAELSHPRICWILNWHHCHLKTALGLIQSWSLHHYLPVPSFHPGCYASKIEDTVVTLPRWEVWVELELLP